MNNKKNKFKNHFILIIIFVLFFLFLINIPNFLDNNKIIYDFERKTSAGESSEIIEQTKFDMVATSVMNTFKDTQMGDASNKYIVDLILNNNVNNRENSIAQEIINFYLLNNITMAKQLATSVIEEELNKFDDEIDRRWRNHVLILIDGNNTIELYNKTNVLRPIQDSKIVGLSSIKVKPYKFQKYYFKRSDGGGVDIVTINLITGEGQEELSNYNNIEGTLDEYIFDDKEYEFKFLIWK